MEIVLLEDFYILDDLIELILNIEVNSYELNFQSNYKQDPVNNVLD